MKSNSHSLKRAKGAVPCPVWAANAIHSRKPVLITGGAGFIGTNLAHRLLSSGQSVIVYDNLSRPGVTENLRWLQTNHGPQLAVEVADVRNASRLRQAVRNASRVFHFAAQVAVTTSLEDPLHDFAVNAEGTLNLLEAIRSATQPPPLLYTSTNKVYGDMDDVELQIRDGRYEPARKAEREHGFSERRPLAFHSPYGCSKGSASQYVLDYARTFRVPAVVFHMSCIYGPHQFGNEDQGWVAHFIIQTLEGKPLTIFGDGRQVRDVLFVEDLVDAFLMAQANLEVTSGCGFNIGGGPAHSTSLRELLRMLGDLHGELPKTVHAMWRAADQRYYVSDIRKFCNATGWFPKVGVREGIARLYQWMKQNRTAAAPAEAADLALQLPDRINGAQRLRPAPTAKEPGRLPANAVSPIEA